jgi:hypothetical protein
MPAWPIIRAGTLPWLLLPSFLPSFKPVIKGYQWRVVAHYVLHFESIKPNEP